RETAAALAPGETNGIGAPILRCDRVLDVTIESRWWTVEGDAPPPEREEGPLVDPKGCRDLAARGTAAHLGLLSACSAFDQRAAPEERLDAPAWGCRGFTDSAPGTPGAVAAYDSQGGAMTAAARRLLDAAGRLG